MRRVLVVLALLLACAAPASGAAPLFTMDEIEREVMCPVCGTRLDLSHAPAAEQIRTFIAGRRDAGWSKRQTEDALVAQFGSTILADTPRSGTGLVAWVAPGLVVVGGGLVAVLAILAWRRRSAGARPPGGLVELDQADAERVDRALADYEA